ncbi:MAG: S49 family peptidase [Thermodesulfovibrionales bacterium]|jgi:signal peptide peptidase SppA
MKISDIINGPWAITPEMLNEIRSIYAKHLRGEKINIAEIEARTGKKLENKPQTYDIINGSAVIPIEGVIAKKMNLFMQISGGVSTQLIERDIREALNDNEVAQIILYIDSPGGTVDGTFELANFIFENRGKKPIIAYTDGMMHSAAYAIGSAADRIYISGDTAALGSIGIVTAHEDISRYEERLGVKTTEIYAGKYKRIASEYAPLSVEGFTTIKERVDYLYSIFVNTIAKFRGVSAEEVLSKMSTDVKPYFIGQQAIAAGLADGVSTLDRLINDKAPAGSAGKNKQTRMEVNVMTKEELKAQRPDIYNAIVEEGRLSGHAAGLSEGIKKGEKEGAAAETARAKAVKEQLIPGHEALIETLMFDGVTTGEQAAVRILAAEKTLRSTKADDLKADAAAAGKVPTDDGSAAAAVIKDFDALVNDHMTANKCSKAVAMSAIAKSNPAEHAAWLTKINTKK